MYVGIKVPDEFVKKAPKLYIAQPIILSKLILNLYFCNFQKKTFGESGHPVTKLGAE
jgi:hypothetical protein